MSISSFLRDNKGNMIMDLGEFIEIPTVLCEDDYSVSHPFGEQINIGLEWLLRKAESFDFKCRNFDGYAGEITVGTGKIIIGILGHEDVVSAGEGWNTEPFKSVVNDGKIYGRGSLDDKGPIISCLYVMKYLRDNDLIPADYSIRMIIGADEEVGWRCIDYYKEHVDALPDYSIVPDGNFPLIFCEKGLIDFDMFANTNDNLEADIVVEELNGGSGRNIVAGKAECTILCKDELLDKIADILGKMQDISIKRLDDNRLAVIAVGKATHAMSPEKGKNAICILLDAIWRLPYSTSIMDFIDKFNKYVGTDYNAGRFGCRFEDELSGVTTLNIGTIGKNGKGITMESNLRYPASISFAEVDVAMKKTLDDAGFSYKAVSCLPSVYVDPESNFVKSLVKAYADNTGDYDSKPMAIGGATYARAIPNAVSFGPLFPYEEELAHEPNEYLSVDSFIKMTAIFSDAIEALMNLGE